jgi:hypothetical protein
MPEEPNTNPNVPPADAQPINGHAANGGEAEKPPLNANAVKAAHADAVAVTDLSEKLEAGDIWSYLSLRQSIDFFEAIALAYYATGGTVQARAARADDIQNIVARERNNLKPDSCAPGERRLDDGTCVPKNQ